MDESDKAECKGCEENVKLQRHYAYRYKDKEYHKNVIVIPDEVVKTLRWSQGQQLEYEVKRDLLIIRATPRNLRNIEREGAKVDNAKLKSLKH